MRGYPTSIEQGVVLLPQSHPGILAAVWAGVLLVWIVLTVKVLRADNLEFGQKAGWIVGLTFVFPVFSVLYFALAPVEPGWSEPPAPRKPRDRKSTRLNSSH